MNTTEPDSNSTLTAALGGVSLSSLTTGGVPHTDPVPPPSPSDHYEPELTIMVVLGLSLLLAGLAAFLAVCRPSQRDGDSEGSCGPGESFARGRGSSSEPQLKVWKRLGSYRRSYNLSFRRPPQRRAQERASSSAARAPAPAVQTQQPEAGAELKTPCLFDYVTEI